MLPKKIYWVSSEKMPNGYIHELPVMERLRSLGTTVLPIVWDHLKIEEIGPSECLIVRTPWDYFSKISKFAAWIELLPKVRVHNSADILKWNADKNYLKELGSLGVRLIPTVWMDAKTEEEVSEVTNRAFPGEEKVLKPVKSAGAFHTYRLHPNGTPPSGVFPGRAAMIQPYLKEIETDGERSLVFFRGIFSHAIRKVPVSGDFRVQEEFGGKFEKFEPSRSELQFGIDVVDVIRKRFQNEPTPLYGRIDYVAMAGVPHLMEAEFLEPDLYFHHAPEAIEHFIEALRKND